MGKTVGKSEQKKGKKSQALIDRILEAITKDNLSLRKACAANDLSDCSFLDWVRQDPELAKQYARAMEIRHERMATEILEIADATDHDDNYDENGKRIPNTEWINRSRLRVDARKWLLSKMLPKKYGDKPQVTNQINNIVKQTTFVDNDIEASKIYDEFINDTADSETS